MTTRTEIRLEGTHEPISHYTDAVVCGDLVFVSGCTAADENLEIVGGDDVAAQARQCLTAIGKILAAAGATFADVLKVTVYLTDINDRPLINPVRQKFFGTTRPASTLVEVSALAIPGAKVEIEAVARVNRSVTS
jgi:2-iminobutanoate/2-iminopropanoate deaminase